MDTPGPDVQNGEKISLCCFHHPETLYRQLLLPSAGFISNLSPAPPTVPPLRLPWVHAPSTSPPELLLPFISGLHRQDK